MSEQSDLEKAVAIISAAYANGRIGALELAAEMDRIGSIARRACSGTDGFGKAPDRVFGELGERVDNAERMLRFHNAFLDDTMRGILPHDLVLIGAATGAGKTDLVTGIARENARRGAEVSYFALEAEPREIERRIKFAILNELCEHHGVQGRDRLNYPDWYIGKCEDVVGKLNAEADAIMAKKLATLHTYYRGSKFDHEDLRRLFLAEQSRTDLFIVDHFHVMDMPEDTDEFRAYKKTMQVIRDLVISAGVPMILVAHLRKRDMRAKRIVPDIEDFHGSSDLGKICTRAVLLAPAHSVPSGNPMTANTFVHVPKDRIGGASGLVALHEYHRGLRSYATRYRLGRPVDGWTDWEELKPEARPRWAGRVR